MQGGTSPRTRFHLNSFNLVGQSPRWSACCPRGARQSPVWGMNEPNGLSTPLWCGQVHCPYGHEPMALWSGFRGGLGGYITKVLSHHRGVDIYPKPAYRASRAAQKGGHPPAGGFPSGWPLKNSFGAYWMFSAIIGFRLCFCPCPNTPKIAAPDGNHGDTLENHETRHRYQFCIASGESTASSA